MDAVEVDIELFVTCRLCLDEQGTYQIVPSVQQQIKYCFDINIETFDGLPQLLCKKCKDVLNDFYATKNKYRDIQNTLKDKLQKKPHITNIESLKVEEKSKNTDGVEYPIKEKSSKEKKLKRLKTRKRRLKNIESLKVKEKSNDTNGVEYPIEEKSSEEKKLKRAKILKKRLEVRKKRTSIWSSSSESPEPSESLNYLDEQVGNDVRYAWEENYNKYFVCHICKKEFIEMCDIETHMKTHNDFIARNSNLFQTTCKINLNKIDEKSNFIGLSTAVVHNEDLIVRHLDGFNYYIVYKRKKKLNIHEFLNRRKRILKSCSKFNDSNDADTYENPSRTKPKKCRGSRSSTETVIVCNNNKAQCDTDDSDNGNDFKDNKRLGNETPFIIIDDTSTESLYVDDTHHTNDEETKRTIKEVVSKTYDYVVTQDNNEIKEHRKNQIEHSESQLNHKILTIGTKVINKQDLPSTGILSYLEIKPLEVKWISRNKTYAVNTRTFVQETSVGPDSGKNVGKSNLCNLEAEKVSVENIEDSENVRIDAMTTDAKDSQVDVDKSVTVAPDCVEKINVLLKKKSDVLAISKLSNLNPVSLPESMDVQKSNTEHKVKQKTVENNIATVENEAVVCIDLIDDTENEDLEHVPVIKHENSTGTSDKPKEVENHNNITDTMLQQESKENCLPDLSIDNTEFVPRIKVKSFLELMPEVPDGTDVLLNDVPENNLPRVCQQARVSSDYEYQCETPAQPIPNNSPVGITPVSQHQNILQNVPTQQATNQLANNSSSKSGTGFMLLHTEQIPKTVTDSPFQYFRDILKKDNIILKETNSLLSNSFKCLGRLKLTVRQEQITKCLKISLWCHSDEVCINVVDELNTNLDINMISSDWQWQILQVFRCEFMDRIIKCAQKINGEVYRNICKFKDTLCSIEKHQM